MTTPERRYRYTDRDRDILAALDRFPLTVLQLLKLSETFSSPFHSERRVQERLADLRAAGWVRRWHFATATLSPQTYVTLSPTGYRILHGDDRPLPSRGHFEPVGLPRERHTRSLTDFLVHTLVGAYRSDVRVTAFERENALRLQLGAEFLYPDGTVQLRTPEEDFFSFFVELDNGSEPVWSDRERDSWQRKLSFYERYQESLFTSPDRRLQRFRVLIATTGTTARLNNILDAAASLARNADRSLFYGVTLAAYLACRTPLYARRFRDHRGKRIALLSAAAPSAPLSIEPVAGTLVNAAAV